MFFTSKSLVILFAFAPAAFAIPGPAWIRRQDDAQSSLTLDPAVISPGLAQDGQGANPDPGQVRSLTSKNNFINHCLTENTALTNGQQIVEGSCNPTPMGRIISLDVSPSSKFVFPKNTESSIGPNQPFVIQMKVKNMALGNFVNAQSNYYAAPQQVNGQGIVIGHTHVVIEPMSSFDTTEPLDPLTFAFFKGVNGAADGNGIVTANVDKGVPAGFYRLCSINTAANHQPVLVSNAQHGSLDDCIYFAVGQGDDPFKLKGGNGNASASASDSASASATDSASASATDSASVSASDSAAATATASGSDTSSSAPAATQSADAGQNGNQNGADQNNNQNGNNNNQQQGGNNNNNQQQGGNNNNNQQQGGNNNNNQQQGGNNNANDQGGNGANNANNANAQGGNGGNNNQGGNNKTN